MKSTIAFFIFPIFFIFLIFFIPPAAHSAEVRQSQSSSALRSIVEQFLHTQTTGLPGQVSIQIGQPDPRLNLQACAAPQAFLPHGSRAWGKTTVGVRCSAPSSWTVYVPATIQVIASYIVAAAPLAQGQLIGPRDIAKAKGDLATLPSGIATDESQVIGRTLAVSLPAGIPIRTDSLRQQQAVQQGQVVRLTSSGPGFQVSSEGRALSNAAEGQVAQARTTAGQVVSGIAKAGGILEISY